MTPDSGALSNIPSCPLAVALAARIRDARADLAQRWLERIPVRVQLEADRVFESVDLLEHVPVLIAGIADYMEDAREITADLPVLAKARELAELRFTRGSDASEVLKEYEMLGSVLFAFSAAVASERAEPCEPEQLIVCSHRLFRAISAIGQVTAELYLSALAERVGEREERLLRFNRMITHELKNRVGATLGAGQLLQEDWLGEDDRRRFAAMVAENARAVHDALDNLVTVSRLDAGPAINGDRNARGGASNPRQAAARAKAFD
jgi:signal transduction histidine kinase